MADAYQSAGNAYQTAGNAYQGAAVVEDTPRVNYTGRYPSITANRMTPGLYGNVVRCSWRNRSWRG